jgi:pimeloyl-ACP methyl ester carboxylesterase
MSGGDVETRLINVDGHRLGLHTTGRGMPPVVLVSGAGDAGDVWTPVIQVARTSAQMVTYDRLGLGDSDPPSSGQQQEAWTFDRAATHLRALLAVGGVDMPCVLVGHSIGGLIVDSYARRWPTEIAGIVLVDASDPDLYLDIDEPQPIIADGGADGGISFDWRAAKAGSKTFSQGFDCPCAVVSSAVGRWERVANPERYQPFTVDQLDRRWQQHQRGLAVLHDTGLLVADTAGHRVHTEAPDLVARAIEVVLAAARRGSREVLLDDADVARAGGRRDESGHYEAGVPDRKLGRRERA